MAGPCVLDSVQFLCGSDVYNHGVFLNAGVYACHTSVTELDSAYGMNYDGNEPGEVMARDTLYLRWESGAWQSFAFDAPFDYNGTSNLILEFRWQGDNDSSVYNLGFYTSGNRAVDVKSSTGESGTPRNYMPRLRIFYTATGVSEGPASRLVGGRTVSATPNPFRSSVTLRADGAGALEASVYTSSGCLVRRIARTDSSSVLCWDGRDEHGRRALPGVYLCRLRGGSRVQAIHLILQR